MSLPPELRPAFDAELRRPLEDTRDLRTAVSAWATSRRAAAEDDTIDVDPERIQAVADCLEALLKRVSRKTTPFHHRLIHATARWCIREDHPLDDRRLRQDVEVLNETTRVVRRPELALT